MLDTYRSIETPEGVELGLRVAGPAPRALAWMIDAAIRTAAYTVMLIPLALLGNFGLGIFFVILFVGEWFYPVLFEVLQGGATPGKRSLALRVLHDDGTPVGWAASTVRNLLRFADFLPVGYGFGLISSLLHPDFKRLGDLAAGTLVVYADRELHRHRVPDAAPSPPPFTLDLDEQRLVIDFAARRNTWSRARAAELASHAHGLTGARGRESADRLSAYAAWLVGRR